MTTPYSYPSAGSANQDSQLVVAATSVRSLALMFLGMSNVSASVRFVKIYDKATPPTSADTPVLRFQLPGNSSGAGWSQPLPGGLTFTNGIGFRITTGAADNDTGAASANDVLINMGYLS